MIKKICLKQVFSATDEDYHDHEKPATKRKRRYLTQDQKAILKIHFSDLQFPTSDQYVDIAEAAGCGHEQAKNYFK
jgi:hypothetical protein